MSGLNLPKSSEQEEKSEEVLAAIRYSRHYEIVRTGAENSLQEIHQARIKNIRKELDYIKETSWKYEPIEKYIR